jgi:hypothetical protein
MAQFGDTATDTLPQNCEQFNEAASKACHPAPDAGFPEKRTRVFRGLRVKPAMTNTLQRTFETASLNCAFGLFEGYSN